MKVKNIAFSGFMAAIMLSVTGAANAAVQIASQAYVDNQKNAAVTEAVTQVETKNYLTKTEAGDTYLTQTDASSTYITEQGATTIVENTLKDTETITKILTDNENGLGKELASKADKDTVDGLSDTVTQLGTDVDTLETTVGNATSGLVKDVTDLASKVNDAENGLATKASQDDLTALDTRVTTNETNIAGKADKLTGDAIKVGNIATIDANGNYVAGDVKADNLVTNSTVTQKITEALEGNESVKEIITTIVSNGDVVTDAINKSVTEGTLKTELDKKASKENFDTLNDIVTDETTGLVKLVADNADKITANTDAITKLNGGVDTEGSVANTVATYALPKPSDNCKTGMCVLSVGADGETLTWVDVTTPYGDK